MDDAATKPYDDPFKEVPSDPLGEGGSSALPPNVQPGSLGGVNPSEEAEPEGEAESEPEAAAEPEPGEFLEEPPETDDDLAAEPERPVAEPENPPSPEPEQPESELPAEPEPESVEPEPETPSEPEPEPEPAAEPDPPTAVEGSGSPPTGGNPVSEKSAEPGETTGETTGKAEEPKPKRKRRRKKKEAPGHRGYVILMLGGQHNELPMVQPGWVEAFERDIPLGEKDSEPVVVDARSAEAALRVAYRRLTDNGEGNFELVPVPVKMFRPKKVEGKVPETALAIKVG